MWRLNKVRHKAGRLGDSSEQFRLKRREQEKALRQARRDRQLVSKRLLLNDDEEHPEVSMETNSAGQDVVSLVHMLQHSGTEKEANLKALSKALREPSAQLTFIKQENSMHLLVGLLTGSNAQSRLQAVRCLHELSHSPHTTVAPACLPATPYLLTYLSGQSTKFTELCLYTLGNLCPDSDVVTEKLLAQGIIPALTSCLENQRHNLALVEAVGFTLSQLLQTKDAAEKMIPTILASSLPSLLLSVLPPDPQFGLAPAIECAWCLHYLTSRPNTVDSRALLSRGALLKCSSLLVSIGGAVADGKNEEGMELRPVWIYVAIPASIICVLILCCCCVKTCCCAKSATALQSAAVPALSYHGMTQPAGHSQSATLQSVRKPLSTSDHPPMYDPVDSNVNPPQSELICPLLRCVGNLLSLCPGDDLTAQVDDVRLPAALCTLLQAYLHTQPALARETAWVLNNLTAHSTEICCTLLTLNLVPGLIQLLPFSQGINTMILRVFANIAYKKKEFCVQLIQLGLLSALCATLKMADPEMVTLSLDVLFMLVSSCPQVPEEFVKQGGLSMIEAIQYNSEGEMRRRAAYLLEHKLLSCTDSCTMDNNHRST